MDGPVSTPSTSIFSRLPPAVLNCFRLHSAQNALVHAVESSMTSSTDQTTHFVVSGGVHAHSQRLASVFFASQASRVTSCSFVKPLPQLLSAQLPVQVPAVCPSVKSVAAVPGGSEGAWQPPSMAGLPTSGAGQSEQL